MSVAPLYIYIYTPLGPVAFFSSLTLLLIAGGLLLGLKGVIRGDGVWRIRRQAGGHDIEVFKVAEHGHGEVLTEEFISWRNSDAMKNPGQPGQPQQQAQEQAQQQPSS